MSGNIVLEASRKPPALRVVHGRLRNGYRVILKR
jgi:hypothetical protein